MAAAPPPLVVAIDGPAGSGKSTLARALARSLGPTWAYMDTGAMYRAVTVLALRRGLDVRDASAMAALASGADVRLDPRGGRVTAGGEDVTEAIRSAEVNAAVSVVAAIPEVREVMRTHQHRFAAEHRQIVAEGRDMGTRVFPRAAVKVFLEADPEERVRRRVAELAAKDPRVDARAVRAALLDRDRADESRAEDPLRPAPDAVRLATDGLSPDKVLEAVRALVLSRIPPSATA